MRGPIWGCQCWIDLRPGTATWEQFGDEFIGEVTGRKVTGAISFDAQHAEIVDDRYVAIPFQTLMEVEVAELCERGLARLDAGHRLEATGSSAWFKQLLAGLDSGARLLSYDL